jgi:hypothetical protein
MIIEALGEVLPPLEGLSRVVGEPGRGDVLRAPPLVKVGARPLGGVAGTAEGARVGRPEATKLLLDALVVAVVVGELGARHLLAHPEAAHAVARAHRAHHRADDRAAPRAVHAGPARAAARVEGLAVAVHLAPGEALAARGAAVVGRHQVRHVVDRARLVADGGGGAEAVLHAHEQPRPLPAHEVDVAPVVRAAVEDVARARAVDVGEAHVGGEVGGVGGAPDGQALGVALARWRRGVREGVAAAPLRPSTRPPRRVRIARRQASDGLGRARGIARMPD